MKKKTAAIPNKPRISHEELVAWRNFDVNIDSALRRWDIEAQDQIDYMKEFSQTQITELGKLLKISGDIQDIRNSIASNSKALLTLIVAGYFLNLNRKTIGRALKAPFLKGKVLETEAIILIIKHFTEETLTRIYVEHLRMKLGKGDHQYSFNKNPSDQSVSAFEKKAKSLARALGHSSSGDCAYKFRFVTRDDHGVYILILRETSDNILPAIPNNRRVVSAKYILSICDFSKKTLEITTRSRREAAIIRSFTGKKLEVSIGFELKEFEGNSGVFFEKILNSDENRMMGCALNGLVAKESVGDLSTQLNGAQSPDQVAQRLVLFREKGILQFKDFNEFKSFRFQSQDGIDFFVRIAGNKWGQKWLHLESRAKPNKELIKFQATFEDHFQIKFNHAIGGAVGDKGIAQTILDQTKIEALLPQKIEEIFISLVEMKIITKPKQSSKRKCLSCGKISWTLGACPVCGGEVMILGAFLDINHDLKGIHKHLKDFLHSNLNENLAVRTKKIDGKIHQFLVISTDNKEAVWIFISTGEPVGHVKEIFDYTGNPLIFIFSKYGKNNRVQSTSESIRVFDLLDFIYEPSIRELKKAIKDLRESSKIRRMRSARSSYTRLQNKPKNYNDQNFEQDIFNLIHELTGQADILGGTFAGTPAPDGVGAISNRNSRGIRRLTFAWDCKFSQIADGYKLRDDPKKHRHYLRALTNNKETKKLGVFKAYLIVSQNMNMKSYEKFHSNLTKNLKWSGNIIFVGESAFLEIFRFYLKFQNFIDVSPYKFYRELYKLFSSSQKERSTSYLYLSEKKLNKFMENVKKEYKKTSVIFKLKRSDFKRE